MGDARGGERLALPRLRGGERSRPRVDRVREPHALCDTRRDPDRPVRTGRDDPVDTAGPREPVDRVLVLGREHRPLGREREAGRARVAVDRDHLQVTARPGGLQQAELGGPGA